MNVIIAIQYHLKHTAKIQFILIPLILFLHFRTAVSPAHCTQRPCGLGQEGLSLHLLRGYCRYLVKPLVGCRCLLPFYSVYSFIKLPYFVYQIIKGQRFFVNHCFSHCIVIFLPFGDYKIWRNYADIIWF